MTAEECRKRLERAGWTVREFRWAVTPGARWSVSGVHGVKPLSAEGRTREEAWQNACRQAEALGLLPPE